MKDPDRVTDSNLTSEVSAAYKPWPARCAVLLRAVTLVLISVGALVTTYDAGMAVPDWPTTYGYNMFAYPWQTWLSGPFDLLIEHGHRLLGSLVGFIAIGLVVAVFASRERAWMKVVSIVTLLAVIGQGILGGARVLFDDRQLAMVHGCVGPAFFALTSAVVGFTSRFWHAGDTAMSDEGRVVPGVRTVRWEPVVWSSMAVAVLAYFQLVLGAAIRHLPIDATASYFRVALLSHVGVAIALTLYAIAAVRVAYQQSRPGLRGPATMLLVLLGMQVVLGVGTYIVKYGFPIWFADSTWAAGFVIQTKSMGQAITVTAHVANGSLILATAVTLAVRAARLSALSGEFAMRSGAHARSSQSSSRPVIYQN
ncbi:MAG: COX15/CtaA family protein [Planctomycetota bacterium]